MIPESPPAERNKKPILEQLLPLLSQTQQVLEIGSGTGQHAVFFAQQMPHLTWQPSEVSENQEIVLARVIANKLPNVNTPIILDVSKEPWPTNSSYGAVYTANTLHIISKVQVAQLIKGASQRLEANGLLLMYGPFNVEGQFTSPSNAHFDSILRGRDPLSGIRDLEWIIQLCRQNETRFVKNVAMPANNMLLVFQKNP